MRAVSLAERLAFHSPHKFKLGLFGPNVSSGRVATKAPEMWSGSWDDNLRMAKIADEAGIEFLLPLGRWKGYGGETDYEGATFETVMWATGLLAQTKRLTAFATVHAPLLHPVIAAKEMVTADHISEGRFGLNLVCGWNENEFQMFGATVRDHEARYEYAQEWIDAVRLAWSDRDDFDFDGKFIRMKGVRSKPKPYGGSRPLLMNAGMSDTGMGFAVRNCDALFSLESKVDTVKALARRQGKDVGVFSAGVVVCRPTRAEAEAYFRYCTVEHADWSAIEGIMKIWRHVDLDAMSPEEREQTRLRFASGQGGLTIVGDPDEVATRLAQLHAMGLHGFAFSLINFADELPYICDEVLPRLARLGLRQA